MLHATPRKLHGLQREVRPKFQGAVDSQHRSVMFSSRVKIKCIPATGSMRPLIVKSKDTTKIVQ